jgi:hypothetical protein
MLTEWLQAVGRAEYVTDLNATFGSLSLVRETLKRGNKIEFLLVDRKSTEARPPLLLLLLFLLFSLPLLLAACQLLLLSA